MSRAFAAGVVLTTGAGEHRYVHVLANAFPILQDPCLGLSSEYPWATVIATAATLFTFTLEWVLQKAFRLRLLMHEDTKTDLEGQDSLSNPKELAVKQCRLRAVRNAVVSYTFEIGIIFHSNEGLALGVLFVKAGYGTLKYMLLVSAFVLETPIGVAIGIGVSSNYNGLSKAALGTEGVFDAVSAGILIYNGLCDLILRTFSDEDLPKSWIMQASGFGALYLGAVIMALIGKSAKSVQGVSCMFIIASL